MRRAKKLKSAWKRIFHQGKNKSDEPVAEPTLQQIPSAAQSPIEALIAQPEKSGTQKETSDAELRRPDAISSPVGSTANLVGSGDTSHAERGLDSNHETDGKEQEEQENRNTTSEEIPSIFLLWDEAFDALAENPDRAKLIETYKGVLVKAEEKTESQKTKDDGQFPKEREQRQKQMCRLIEQETKKIEDGTWKIRFKDRELAVKDFVQPVFSILEWVKGFVGEAAQVSPPASIAWAGVCLLLPLLLRPGKQEESRVKSLDKISSIMRECSLREFLYHKRYESGGKCNEGKDINLHKEYRGCIKDLYSDILTFEATYVCFLSEHNTVARQARDVVDWEGWDGMITTIIQRNETLKSLESRWQEYSQQQEWEFMAKRHDDNLTRLDAMKTEMRRIYNLLSESQCQKERSSLLEWLQTGAMPSTHYNAAVAKRRKYATGEWFLQSDEFDRWKGESNSFLWIIGKAGAGKSVLSSTIIGHLETLHKADPFTAVAYFYISATDKATCNINNLTRSLVRQLFGRRPDKPNELTKLGRYRDTAGGVPPQEELEIVLRLATRDLDRTYIVIDGLDECPTSRESGRDLSDRREFLQLLYTIHTWNLDTIHLLLTSRREQDIEDALQTITEKDQAQIIDLASESRSPKVTSDIILFIDKELEKGPFKNQSRKVKDQIREGLAEKADGVFHYVSLQLESFPVPITQNSVKVALQNLPKDLNDTYKKALDRLPHSQEENATCALTWVAFSLVPLTITELAAAVPVSLSTVSKTLKESHMVTEKDYAMSPFDPGDRIQPPRQVLYLLPGLHNLQKKDSTEKEGGTLNPDEDPNQVVVLTHFTLLEFLTSKDIKMAETSQFALDRVTANCQLAAACLRYHIHLSQKESVMDDHQLRTEYPLWSYVACYGLQHAENAGQASWPAVLRQLIRCVLSDGSISFEKLKLFSGYTSHRAYSEPIQYAIDKKLSEIVTFLLDENLAQIDTKPKSGDAVLIQAVDNLDKHMVELLLHQGAHYKIETDSGEPLLCRAARNRDLGTMKVLIEHGAEIDVKVQGGELLLIELIRKKDTNVAEFLITMGASVDLCNNLGETALIKAVSSRCTNLVTLLLAKNPNVRAKTKAGETALHWAAYYNEEEQVRQLLGRGADPNASTQKGETALHWAASRRAQQVLMLLIEGGAAINAKTYTGDTPLHMAIKGRDYLFDCKDTIKFLLEHGADVNALNEAGESAMYLVAKVHNMGRRGEDQEFSE